ncbi:MAG: hypothetical protein ACXVGA_04315 [Mycobacteriaceae bacterium]
MSEITKPRRRFDRRIPCVVFMWVNDANAIAVGFTSTYREAKRIEREVRRFHADTGITEAWNWPLRRTTPTPAPQARAGESEGVGE